jgi:hypothetical protein
VFAREDGFIARALTTVVVFSIAIVVVTIGAVFTWISVVHDAAETIAAHAALQLAAGGSPSVVLPNASQVGSISALQACHSECYYVVPGNSQSLVWKVFINNPFDIGSQAFPMMSAGVAPWQP